MTSVELQAKLNNLELEMVVGIFIDGEEDYSYDGFSVNISEKFYLENKDMIDTFIKKVCSYKRQFVKSLYFISRFHMTKEYFGLLKENETLQTITLHNHCLTKEEFNLLIQNKSLTEINSSSISPELSNCYDKRLGAVMKKHLTDFLTVRNIIFDDKLRIYEKLTEEQATEICKYLEKRKVQGTLNFSSQNDGRLVKKIIDKFESIIGKNTEDKAISIEIEKRHDFDYRAFTDEKQNATITVITETDEPTDMNTFIKTEKELRKLIEPLEEHKDELSPFEKHLWLHNLVATFRKYKKETNEGEWKESRYLNKLLFNDYLVCVGFSYLNMDLAKRLSLESWEDAACSNRKERKLNEYTHSINLSYIEDNKYDIKGVYLSDTTFDNHEDKDLFVFNHFFITPDKYESHLKDMFSSGYSLLNIKDKEEFLRILKGDRQALYSLVIVISKYYPKHEIFNIGFSNSQDYYDYLLEKADELYDIAQTIHIEPISEEKIKKALVHIEKIINPNITIEELDKKINRAFEIYNEINEIAYNKSAATTKSLQ